MDLVAYSRAVAYRIKASTGTRIDVEDLAQEGVLAGLRARKRCRGDEDRFLPFRIRGACLDAIRAQQDELGLPDPVVVCDVDAAERREARDVVGEAMRVLDPRQTALVRGYYFEGLELKEMAPLLGVTPSRCSQLHRAALQKMRRHLRTKYGLCGWAN